MRGVIHRMCRQARNKKVVLPRNTRRVTQKTLAHHTTRYHYALFAPQNLQTSGTISSVTVAISRLSGTPTLR